jgi:hypothetical protein
MLSEIKQAQGDKNTACSHLYMETKTADFITVVP